MASLNGVVYVVCNGLYKVLPDGSYDRLGDASWANATHMVGAEDGNLYIIENGDGIYQVNKDSGEWSKCGDGSWKDCQGLCAAQKSLWVIQDGTIYKVTYDGEWTSI
jgi:hypothetical protein